MNSETVQKPVADEGANDPNRRVADETETVARTTLPANHPAMSPTTKMTINPWSDRCMLISLALRPDLPWSQHCKETGLKTNPWEPEGTQSHLRDPSRQERNCARPNPALWQPMSAAVCLVGS